MESSSGGLMPALLQQMSIPPKAAGHLGVQGLHLVGGRDVGLDEHDRRPTAATAPPASSSRSTTATEAPSLAKRSHMALPDAAGASGDDGHAADESVGVRESCRSCLRSVLPHGRYSELMKTFFTSLNASSASGPSSRPIPDCFTPPKGVQ